MAQRCFETETCSEYSMTIFSCCEWITVIYYGRELEMWNEFNHLKWSIITMNWTCEWWSLFIIQFDDNFQTKIAYKHWETVINANNSKHVKIIYKPTVQTKCKQKTFMYSSAIIIINTLIFLKKTFAMECKHPTLSSYQIKWVSIAPKTELCENAKRKARRRCLSLSKLKPKAEIRSMLA